VAPPALPPRMPAASHPLLDPALVAYFVAGGAAGAASRTVVSPLERLKIIQCARFCARWWAGG
jgi:solute carrier family 25 phosphate transporter 23/24/25/41